MGSWLRRSSNNPPRARPAAPDGAIKRFADAGQLIRYFFTAWALPTPLGSANFVPSRDYV
jgi:hypothetical protein